MHLPALYRFSLEFIEDAIDASVQLRPIRMDTTAPSRTESAEQPRTVSDRIQTSALLPARTIEEYFSA